MVFFFNTGTRTSIRLCSTKLEIFQKIWPYCWCIQTPSVCISAILKISLEKQNERIAADHRQIKNIRFYHILLYIRIILKKYIISMVCLCFIFSSFRLQHSATWLRCTRVKSPDLGYYFTSFHSIYPPLLSSPNAHSHYFYFDTLKPQLLDMI